MFWQKLKTQKEQFCEDTMSDMGQVTVLIVKMFMRMI